jgi:class 3 adenylate cyclase
VTTESIARGLDAVARRRWSEAYELLSAADAEEILDGAGLDALADAAFALGHHEQARDAHERAYTAHAAEGDASAAASSAIKLGVIFVRRGEIPRVMGWLSSAERQLEDQPESVGHGLVTWMKGMFGVVQGDLAAAEAMADRTIDIGRRLGDLELQTLGLAIRADVRSKQGRLGESGPLFDEVMAVALGPGLSPWASCHVLCRTMIACQETGDFARGLQWVAAAREAYLREGVTPLSGDCRIHHAGLLNWQGEWAEAEEEVAVGCEELPRDVMHLGMASYEVGEIRLQRGDLAGAQGAFERAHELGRSPQPGLALVRLAQGQGKAAMSMIEAALEDEGHPVGRALLLGAQVEIALAGGELELARTAAAEVAGLDDTLSAPLVEALARSTAGAVALAEDDATAACPSLRSAVKLWTQIGAPYRTARARLLLAESYVGRGDRDAAALELRAARTAFERLHAHAYARRAANALRALGPDVASATRGDQRVQRAFMFTDIVSSTPLVEALGDEAWTDLLRWHDNALRSEFAAHSGQEVDHTGDGFFVAFDSVDAALQCGESIQRKLVAHRRAQGFAPHVRIGVHLDEATSGDESYRGRGVHVAARVGAQAEAGEVLVSAATLKATGVEFEVGEPRTAQLKGVTEPVKLVPIAWS